MVDLKLPTKAGYLSLSDDSNLRIEGCHVVGSVDCSLKLGYGPYDGWGSELQSLAVKSNVVEVDDWK